MAPAEAFEHQPDRFAVRRRHAGDRGFGKPGRMQAFEHRRMDRGRGLRGIRPAAQDADVARLQAQRAGIRRHIGPALIDHPDHADRRGNARDIEPARHRPARQFAPDGIGQRGHVFHAFRHRLDALVVQRQPVEQRRGQARRLARRDVLRVGRKNVRFARADCRGCGQQSLVLRFGRSLPHRARGALRSGAQRQHVVP
ncbi:MAG: hypothetical protein WDM81_12100 [Rhizomicrobium sp.]